MSSSKCGISNVSYSLRFSPVKIGLFFWSKTVFKWQVVKLYTQNYDNFCEFTNFIDHTGFREELVVAEFDESSEARARDVLVKFQKSLEGLKCG